MTTLLAHANQLWYSLPVVVAVSLSYAATRHEDMPSIVRHAVRLGFWIFVFFGALSLLLWWLGRGL